MSKSPEEIMNKYKGGGTTKLEYSPPESKGYLVRSVAITLLLTAWAKLIFWTMLSIVVLHYAIKYW
jgi:hypothetical protein